MKAPQRASTRAHAKGSSRPARDRLLGYFVLTLTPLLFCLTIAGYLARIG